jgi:hypothetical protein
VYLIKTFLVLILLLPAVHCGVAVAAAQQEPAQAVLLSEEPPGNCEALLWRLDHFYTNLQENPGSIGFVVVAGPAAKRRESLFRERWILRYTNFRGFDQNRIKIVRTLAESETGSYWRVPPGAAEPVVNADTSYEIPASFKPFIFASDEINQQVECAEYDDGTLLAHFLKANPRARANLVFRDRSRRQAKERAARTVADLVGEYGIARRRLNVFIVRGSNQPGDEPLSEFWYLP